MSLKMHNETKPKSTGSRHHGAGRIPTTKAAARPKAAAVDTVAAAAEITDPAMGGEAAAAAAPAAAPAVPPTPAHAPAKSARTRATKPR